MMDWNRRLRAARRDLGLSPGELASRAGLSEASVRAYEMGRRRPTREHLARVLECLRLDRQSRNEVFAGAGFAPDGVEPSDDRLTRQEVTRLVNERPWPSFVVNDLMEILAANRAALRLTGLRRPVLADRVQRNVMVLAAQVVSASPSEQNGDWGVAARRAIARMKAAGVGTPKDRDAYFEALVERMAQGDAVLAHGFMRLWEATPASRPPGVSWSYPARFTLPNGSDIRLHCIATRVNDREIIEIHDWIPADAESAAMLERVITARGR